jgi:hypothetical protein
VDAWEYEISIKAGPESVGGSPAIILSPLTNSVALEHESKISAVWYRDLALHNRQ